MNCIICKQSENNEVLYGEILSKTKVKAVHYYCLLFSTNLEQRGKDSEGILGFLLDDIIRIGKRHNAHSCIYCGKRNATVICADRTCRQTFHMICAVKNYCRFEFTGAFNCYCSAHNKRNKLDKPNRTEDNCSICVESLGTYKPWQNILANCCHNGWFHKYCLANYALYSGYFFKCPLCNNSQQFRKYVEKRGIYIPDRDANWELVPDAFAELHERPKHCEAPICKCPQGRTFKGKNWLTEFCYTCGHSLRHQNCITNWKKQKNYICDICKTVENNCTLSENNQSKSTERVLDDGEIIVISDSDDDDQQKGNSNNKENKVNNENEIIENRANIYDNLNTVTISNRTKRRGIKRRLSNIIVLDVSDDDDGNNNDFVHTTLRKRNCQSNTIEINNREVKNTSRSSSHASFTSYMNFFNEPSEIIVFNLGQQRYGEISSTELLPSESNNNKSSTNRDYRTGSNYSRLLKEASYFLKNDGINSPNLITRTRSQSRKQTET